MDSKETGMERWRSAMLSENPEKLLALARNYLGHAGKAVDRNKIVSGLEAVLSSPEVQEVAIAMMDETDRLVLGVMSLAGSTDRFSLQKLLEGEISYHELEYRLANLTERLLVYQDSGALLAINPLFQDAIRTRVATAEFLFGRDADRPPAGAGKMQDAGSAVSPQQGKPETSAGVLFSVQDLGLIAFSFLKENKSPLLQSGKLTVRSRRRLATLLSRDEKGPDIVEAVIHALLRLRIAQQTGQELVVDFEAFEKIFTEFEDCFAFAISLAYVNGVPDNSFKSVSKQFMPFFGKHFVFSGNGLSRFVRIMFRNSLVPGIHDAYGAALRDFGMIEDIGNAWRCVYDRVFEQRHISTESGKPSIIIEGTGIVHILPSAGLREALTLLDIGRLVNVSDVWTVEISRDSLRRAFSEGYSSDGITDSLEQLSGAPLPQALKYNIGTWEEEYNTIMLFRGQVLAVDARMAKIIEQSGIFSQLMHKKIGEGIYYFGNVPASVIEKAIAALGLPAPALVTSFRAGRKKTSSDSGKAGDIPAKQEKRPRRGSSRDERWVGADFFDGDETEYLVANGILSVGDDAVMPISFESPQDAARLDSGEFEKTLFEEVARLSVREPFRKQLEERIRRKLIYSIGQIHAVVDAAGMAAEKEAMRGTRAAFKGGSSAGGLDFQGKVRIIQTALKAKFSRLEIKWMSNGEVRSAIMRPVNLAKTESDYLLTGEDVALGQPLAMRVGSIMQVSLQKGFLLGDE